MPRIVVAVDGSEPSRKAAKYAAELARKLGLQLQLVHVQAPIVYPTDPMGVAFPDFETAARERADETLDDELQLVRGPGVTVNGVVLMGSPAETIAELAKDADVELLVVGSRGRNALARVLIGSVADRLVHISPKPVLVVR